MDPGDVRGAPDAGRRALAPTPSPTATAGSWSTAGSPTSSSPICGRRAPDWATVIELGRRFHARHRRRSDPDRDARGAPPPLGARRAARLRRGALSRSPARSPTLDADARGRGAPDTAPAQLVHVDLTTNVFVAPDGVPVVLDIAPGRSRGCVPRCGRGGRRPGLARRRRPTSSTGSHPDPGPAHAPSWPGRCGSGSSPTNSPSTTALARRTAPGPSRTGDCSSGCGDPDGRHVLPRSPAVDPVSEGRRP